VAVLGVLLAFARLGDRQLRVRHADLARPWHRVPAGAVHPGAGGGADGAGQPDLVPIGVWVGLRPVWARRIQPAAQFLAAFPANLLFPPFVIAIVYFHLNVDICFRR